MQLQQNQCWTYFIGIGIGWESMLEEEFLTVSATEYTIARMDAKQSQKAF